MKAQGSGSAETGFTLVEVMIAAAIMGFVILGVGSLSTFTTRTTTYARRATGAATIARNAIEEARNTPYANLTTLNSTVCFGKDLVQLASCAVAGVIFTRSITVGVDTPIAGLTEIRVLVTWLDEKQKQRRAQLVSSISMY